MLISSIENVLNKNIVLYEITNNSVNGYLYAIPSDNDNYIFFGSAVNRNYNYNKLTIQEIVKIFDYGNYSGYSSNFNIYKMGF